jgi:Na+-driven multidrug efflux pump
LGVGVVLGNAMAGAGATRMTLAIDMLVILGLQFPLSIAAVSLHGSHIHILFQCIVVVNFASAASYCLAYARGGWKRALARQAAIDH